MAVHPEPLFMTVEDYYRLPERDDVILELHWGRVVELSRPKPWLINLRHRIANHLEARVGPEWLVLQELPFRAVSEFDLRGVNIGVIARTRWEAVGEDELFGPPEVVVEILYRQEIAASMALLLATGTQQFCTVDRGRRTVSVTGRDGKTIAYSNEDEVPFPLLGTSIRVSEIWTD